MPRPMVTLALLTALFCGCATHTVRVNSYLDGPSGGVRGNASVHVVEDPNEPNLLLQREISLKIEMLLESSGFTRAPFESCDYLLFFDYGVDDARRVVDMMPIRRPGATMAASSYTAGVPSSAVYDLPDSTTYVPYTRTVYGKYMALTLVEGSHFRGTQEKRQVWVGEAVLTSSSSDFRDAVNFLLVGAFASFGEDTRRQLSVKIRTDDARIKTLRAR